MSSSYSGLRFDGNGNGKYGESGDDIGIMTTGILNIQAKPRSAVDALTITATDLVKTYGDTVNFTGSEFTAEFDLVLLASEFGGNGPGVCGPSYRKGGLLTSS